MSAQIINIHEQFVWSMENMFFNDTEIVLDLGSSFVSLRGSDVVRWKRLGRQLLSLTVKRPAYRRLIANMPHD